MAAGRDRHMRRHTSTLLAALLAMTANINRDRKKRPRPFVPAEFDPGATAADVAAQRRAARASQQSAASQSSTGR